MTSRLRRQNILERMKDLEAQGMSCHGCSGTCCTYEANSMMVTALEAFELLHYLKTNSLLDEELRAKCNDAVKRFRLDQQLSNGKRSLIRRTYTCPFFHHKEFGCPLPREIKPYGCLAFNAHHSDLKSSEHCYSELKLLEDREKNDIAEKKLNESLKERFKLAWEKSPLPLALLEIWDHEVSAADLG